MWRRLAIFFLALAAPAGATEFGALEVRGTAFELRRESGVVLTSKDLVGVSFELETGQGQVLTFRIDGVTATPEAPDILLHSFSYWNAPEERWSPLCEPDRLGRRVGFPLAGAWRADGRLSRTPGRFFLTCTGGVQGKCVLLGYAPWRTTPAGVPLSDYYETCTRMLRADYLGRTAGHTRNGTEILIFDDIGVQEDDPTATEFQFEAGWTPSGAVCVARTRWPELLPLSILLESEPRLGGPCDVTRARRGGALIYSRIR